MWNPKTKRNNIDIEGEWIIENYRVSSFYCSPIDNKKISDFKYFRFYFTNNEQLYLYIPTNENSKIKEIHLNWDYNNVSDEFHFYDLNNKKMFYMRFVNENQSKLKVYFGMYILFLKRVKDSTQAVSLLYP